SRSDPSAGLYQSSLNDAFVFFHVLAQFAFVVVGAVWLRESRARTAFLCIALPLSILVSLVTFIGLIAK
ncbi:MAG TPA: hypothetical protein VEW69_00295, partial [Alphaproteobacteria bacterium]|nr:hypothetical protein [Alphaproteobacteria bacterium]